MHRRLRFNPTSFKFLNLFIKHLFHIFVLEYTCLHFAISLAFLEILRMKHWFVFFLNYVGLGGGGVPVYIQLCGPKLDGIFSVKSDLIRSCLVIGHSHKASLFAKFAELLEPSKVFGMPRQYFFWRVKEPFLSDSLLLYEIVL